MEWLTTFTGWLAELIQLVLEFLFDLLTTLVVWVIDGFSSVVVTIIGAISLPANWTSSALQTLVEALPDGVSYFLAGMRIPEAIGIIVTAVGVRLLRKLATLFQW